MSPDEAATALQRLKLGLLDRGLVAQAGETEHYEEILGFASARRPRAEAVEVAQELARGLLPPGRRGWARYALRRPEEALALARTVSILRAVR